MIKSIRSFNYYNLGPYKSPNHQVNQSNPNLVYDGTLPVRDSDGYLMDDPYRPLSTTSCPPSHRPKLDTDLDRLSKLSTNRRNEADEEEMFGHPFEEYPGETYPKKSSTRGAIVYPDPRSPSEQVHEARWAKLGQDPKSFQKQLPPDRVQKHEETGNRINEPWW